MPVLNKNTGQWEQTPKEILRLANKNALKALFAGQTVFNDAEKEQILLQVARDLGYIDPV